MAHEHIRDNRDDRIEAKEATHHLSLVTDYQPPCSRDISVFSPSGWTITHHDPLEWRKLPPVQEELPPFSFCTSPYARMFSEQTGQTWENDPDVQRRKLKEYFDALESGKSLVFLYANHGNPMTEDKHKRLIVGVARIKEVGEQQYFPTTTRYKEQNPVWSRRITIDHPDQSLRLPYQEYSDNGLDWSKMLCVAPETVRDEFSYVSEHLTDDKAVIVLEELLTSVRTVIDEKKVSGDWESRLEWLNKVLAETWKSRGRYPGLGSVLEHLGARRGTTYQLKVLAPLSNASDPRAHVIDILEARQKPETEFRRDLELARASWNDLKSGRKGLLKILSTFELSKAQADRIANSEGRREAGIEATDQELIDNPYVICELDNGGNGSPAMGFEQIDHGMIPPSELPEEWEDVPIVPPNDKRRVRSLLCNVLNSAGAKGDTVLSLPEALSRVRRRLPTERGCNPDSELILESQEFYKERLALTKSESGRWLVALRKTREMEKEVCQTIQDLVHSSSRPKGSIEWSRELERKLGAVGFSRLGADIETQARKEKATALQTLYEARFSVLTGRAGTGKTLLAETLLGVLKSQGEDLLLLAPTGKARVRLQEMTNMGAKTIHQFLNENEWLRSIGDGSYEFKEKGGKTIGKSTILVDEASMVPLDLLATLFRAIDFNPVRRLILIGDPNQLPPIGPGRPFVDIVRWLDQSTDLRQLHAQLRERVRQEKRDSEALRLSDGYAAEDPTPNDDEILSKVATGYKGGDLEVHYWNSSEELYKKLDDSMVELLGIENDSDAPYASFNASLGIETEGNRTPESWQILSPVRMQPYGTGEINRRVQEKYHKGMIEYSKTKSKSPRPFGEEQIVFTDKVIQLVNRTRTAYNEKRERIRGYVANGEIGSVRSTSKGPRKNQDGVSVRFSSQSGLTYWYFRPEVGENLELAYAITIHKAQGSDFDIVFLVVPQSSQVLSREIFYTSLTRFRKRLVMLVENNINTLRDFRSLTKSETLLRNTNLFTEIVRPDGVDSPFPEKLINRTKANVLVRSKSELVIANILTDLGITYEYEKPLEFAPNDFRLPDFTISYKGRKFYWEHLGMLNLATYKEDWIRKKAWYESHGQIENVITSQESDEGGIDSLEIEKIARERVLQ
jgi:exodeoxyribonuclease V alpha subunit